MAVVMLVLLILSAFAVPQLLRALRRYQLESSARNVAGMLLRARYEAIRRDQNVTTVYSGGSPPVYGLDLNGNNNLDPDEPRTPLSSNVVMSMVNAPALASMGPNYSAAQVPPGFRVTYSPRGTSMQQVAPQNWIEATAVYVLFLQHQTDGAWAAVTVTPPGRLRVWFWNGTGWIS
jgi:Tfp pilus assembly protein FimT